jgi:hypothetical protein
MSISRRSQLAAGCHIMEALVAAVYVMASAWAAIHPFIALL